MLDGRRITLLVAALSLLAPLTSRAQIGGAVGTELVVPIVANSVGAHGATHVSQLVFSSDFPPPIGVKLQLFPPHAERFESNLTLQQVPTVLPLDAAFSGLPQTSGWLLVEASRPVRVESRTSGAVVHAVPRCVALLPGETTRLAGAIDGFGPSPSARYNFGAAEVSGAPIVVKACLQGRWYVSAGAYQDGGTFQSCSSVSVPALGSFQINAFSGLPSLPPASSVTDAEVMLMVPEGTGRAVAWATSIDENNRATGHDMEPSTGLSTLLAAEPGNLVLTKTGSGTGSIRLFSGDVWCGGECRGVARRPLDPETNRFVAEPSDDSVFGGWLGCDAVDGEVCTVSGGTSRRVTASFSRSVLTINAVGFMDVNVAGSSGSTSCSGPSRRCEIPVAPETRVEVTAAAWPGVASTSLISFDGPGCDPGGCSLDVVADPAVVSAAMYQLPLAHIVYFGAYPASIRRGEASRLLVRTGRCSLGWSLTPEGGVTEESPGLFLARPTTTTTYEYTCYDRLPGSSVVDKYEKSVTVAVTESPDPP